MLKDLTVSNWIWERLKKKRKKESKENLRKRLESLSIQRVVIKLNGEESRRDIERFASHG
jgi:hypothetical protein